MLKVRGRIIARAIMLLAVIVTTSAGAAEKIKIGATLALTGPVGSIGDPEKKVLEMYVDRINKGGGVLGRQIELFIYDDAAAADRAIANARRLLQSDNVDVIIGGTITPTTLAIAPLAERAGVPVVSVAGGTPVGDPLKKWVFKMGHDDRMAVERTLRYMKKIGLAKIAILTEDAAFGKSGREEALRMAPNLGIDIVGDEIYSSRDPDVSSQLTRIRNVPGLQAVLAWGYGPGPVVVTKNYRQLGMTQPLFQSHGVGAREYITMSGEGSDGVRLTATSLIIVDQLPDTDPQKPVITLFKEEYKKKYGVEPSNFAGYAYDAINIVLAAINRAGSIDRGKIRDEIEKTSGYVSTSGMVSMTPTDHIGLPLHSLRVVEVKKGNFMLVE